MSYKYDNYRTPGNTGSIASTFLPPLLRAHVQPNDLEEVKVNKQAPDNARQYKIKAFLKKCIPGSIKASPTCAVFCSSSKVTMDFLAGSLINSLLAWPINLGGHHTHVQSLGYCLIT
ncbi:hypothetical protein ATANTOWER_000670 [Ataeniobius toweri]|uniref:Uncharacterized protein n=1 Tax=Ataeniobius toweri TaxID=208326 RepID=A0ABU7A4I4_9TELE|nr:hypothetical protein [Ataeniobius toweri]